MWVLSFQCFQVCQKEYSRFQEKKVAIDSRLEVSIPDLVRPMREASPGKTGLLATQQTSSPAAGPFNFLIYRFNGDKLPFKGPLLSLPLTL